MEKTIDEAITKMAEQAKACNESQKSLHFSQACLNLAHAKAIVRANAKKGTSAS